MAIINSYPTVTPSNSDLLLLVDTSVEGNPTKTATVSSVSGLVNKGYKSFSALITQELAAQPTMVILNNDLGFTPTVELDGTGRSLLNTQTPNVLYDSDKTQILVTPYVTWDQPATQTLRTIFAAPKTAQTIGFWSFDINNTVANDFKFFVEIKIYD